MDGGTIHVLVMTHEQCAARYHEHFAWEGQMVLSVVTSDAAARERLDDPNVRTDILVADCALNNAADVYRLVNTLREQHPHLLILLVDEEADFAMPGHADEVTVAPFEDGDLIKRIKRLAEERRLETLRTDVMPQVRAFARALRRTKTVRARQEAAVEAVLSMDYDYGAVYQADEFDPGRLTLAVQDGPQHALDAAPRELTDPDALPVWVSRNGQSRVFQAGDGSGHPFADEGWFARGACVPIGSTFRFGVLVAARVQPQAIGQHQLFMLELIGAQLANALTRQG